MAPDPTLHFLVVCTIKMSQKTLSYLLDLLKSLAFCLEVELCFFRPLFMYLNKIQHVL